MTHFLQDDITRLTQHIKKSEGLRLTAYRCPAGALTIGYGHNCDATPVQGIAEIGDSITLEQAEVLLSQDLGAVLWRARQKLPWITGLDAARQAALYDMAFNMGIQGLLSFVNTLRYVRDGNYAKAARNMLASKWARQVKNRAHTLARQMETGEWQ